MLQHTFRAVYKISRFVNIYYTYQHFVWIDCFYLSYTNNNNNNNNNKVGGIVSISIYLLSLLTYQCQQNVL